MFESLLIANRGEIACRILRSARRLGIRTIAVYSEADAGAPHVALADDAVPIGPAPATESYLNQRALVDAIATSAAAAVHPGYGFLSESAEFAAAVAAAGATFVGPSPPAIQAMGSKIDAKRLVAAAGAPVVPGYDGAEQSAAALLREAEKIGFPVLIKASMGGGGKGMRSVARGEDFAAALAAAKREAAAAFGDESVLLERHLQAPKHIEIQILADAAGNTLSLFERDCSVQRRHQKVLEEAPAPTVYEDLRQAMGAAAVNIAKAVGYVGAGTVEFLVDNDRAGESDFYFLEMNTRLQVEHPITEAILGLDLVEWQLRIAAGEALPFKQDDLKINGHAVEARLYAENAKRHFLPSTGKLRHVSFSDAVRVDAGVESGSEVSVYYDAMLAKVIAHGADRRRALATLRTALQATEIVGVEHNIAWLVRALDHPRYLAGDYDTDFAEAAADDLTPPDDPIALAAGFAAVVLDRTSDEPWSRRDGFQVNLPAEQILRARHGGERVSVRLVAIDNGFLVIAPDGEQRLEDVALSPSGVFSARVNGRPVRVRIVKDGNDVFAAHQGGTERLTLVESDAGAFGKVQESGGRLVAPMPGRILAVEVSSGDHVAADQVLVVLEAMKMEHNIRARAAGRVTAVRCAVGDNVDDGAELIDLAPD